MILSKGDELVLIDPLFRFADMDDDFQFIQQLVKRSSRAYDQDAPDPISLSAVRLDFLRHRRAIGSWQQSLLLFTESGQRLIVGANGRRVFLSHNSQNGRIGHTP